MAYFNFVFFTSFPKTKKWLLLKQLGLVFLKDTQFQFCQLSSYRHDLSPSQSGFWTLTWISGYGAFPDFGHPFFGHHTYSTLHLLLLLYMCHIKFVFQSYSDRIEAVFVAYDLFKKAMESLKIGSMSEALPAFQSCYQIR